LSSIFAFFHAVVYNLIMKYIIENNKIVVTDTSDFKINQILECGQIFRFKKIENGEYIVYFKNNYAKIIQLDNKAIIETNNIQETIKFFDLDKDYSRVKKSLSKFDLLKEPIKFGSGIRILKGDPEEIIFSFIISANNNIKRIQKIIDKLCELGENKGEYNAFPSAKVIASASDEFLSSLHAGYRAPYLKKTAEILSNVSIKEKEKLSTPELKKWLISLAGVGPKVASCILLFGFSRFDTFPVDTWIDKVYHKYFYVGEKTRPEIERYFVDLFGDTMSGIAQQYLFYFARENGLNVDWYSY